MGNDRETVLIDGIIVDGPSRLPLLKWLRRFDGLPVDKPELMIFISPHLIPITPEPP